MSLLRTRPGSLRSLIEALQEGNPTAIAIVVGVIVLLVVIFVGSHRLSQALRARFERDEVDFGRDFALVRRAAREHRCGRFLLALVWAILGLFLGTSFFVGSLPEPFDFGEPGFWIWASSLSTCLLIGAFFGGQGLRVPTVDDHPLWQLARERPESVEALSFVKERDTFLLVVRARDQAYSHELKFSADWGTELVEKLGTIFPAAKIVAVRPP